MELSQVNKDFKMVQFFIKVGRIVGIIPLYTSKSSWIKKVFSVLYLTVLTSLLGSLFIISVNDRQSIYKGKKITAIVVDSLVLATNFLFILLVRFGNIINCSIFTEFYDVVSTVERCLISSDFKICKMYIIRLYAEFILFHALYCGINCYEFWFRIVTGNNTILIWVMYLPSFLKMYHHLFVINLVNKINGAINERYKFLQECLDTITTREKLNMGSIEMNQKTLNLDQIFNIFKLLHKLVTYINILFGWQIFFVISCTVLEVLNVISFLKQDQEWSVVAIDLAYGTIYIISTIAIIKSCDDVQTNAEKIILSCYTSQETLKGTFLENELLRFAELSKPLLPQYTAGGLVKVNQQVLSSLFSATITYLIVIIQFDLST